MYPNCLHVILEVFLSFYFIGWGGKIAKYIIQEAFVFLLKIYPKQFRERERERESVGHVNVRGEWDLQAAALL